MAEVKQIDNHSFYTRIEAVRDEAEFEFEKVKKQLLDKVRDVLDSINPDHYEKFVLSINAHQNYGDEGDGF